MRISSAIAAGAFFVSVPLGFVLAFLGFRWGLYPYATIPFVLVGVVLLVLLVLLLVLPRIRTLER